MAIRPTTDTTNNPTPEDVDEVYSADPSSTWSKIIEDAFVCGDEWELPLGDPADPLVGPAGPAGADGEDGADGATGATGPAGADSTVPGPMGPAGPAGVDGVDGIDGVDGVGYDPNNPPADWGITNGQTAPGSSFIVTAQYHSPTNSNNLFPDNVIPFNTNLSIDTEAGMVLPFEYTIATMGVRQSLQDGFRAAFSVGIWVDDELVWSDQTTFAIGTLPKGFGDVVSPNVVVPAGARMRIGYGGGNNYNLTVTVALGCHYGAGSGACHYKQHQYTYNTGVGNWFSSGDRNSYGKENVPAPFPMSVTRMHLNFKAEVHEGAKIHIYGRNEGGPPSVPHDGVDKALSTAQSQIITLGYNLNPGEAFLYSLDGNGTADPTTDNVVAVIDCLPAANSGGISEDVWVFTDGDSDTGTVMGIYGELFVAPRSGTISAAGLCYNTDLGTGRYATININGGGETTLVTIPDNSYHSDIATGLNIAINEGDLIEFKTYGGASDFDFILTIQLSEAGTGVALSVNNYSPAFGFDQMPLATRIGTHIFVTDGLKGSGTRGTMAYFDGNKWIAYDSGLPVEKASQQATHWKITPLMSDDSTYWSINKIELRGLVGGIDLTGSGTASASSVNSSNAAANAFDSNDTTYWRPSTNNPYQEYIIYDFGATPVEIKEIVMKARDDSTHHDQMVRFFMVSYSLDGGVTWIDVKTFYGDPYTQNSSQTFAL